MSSDSPERSSESPKSQIPPLIASYASRIRAIRRCAAEHLQFAKSTHATWIESIKEKVTALADAGGVSVTLAKEDVRELIERTSAPHSEILSQSLLIFGFSTFDAFVGMFLRQLYRDEPYLIYLLEEKTFAVSDLIKCGSLDDAISQIIERDVSSLLRNSYDKQFSILAARHGLNTLKKFETWPRFVEAAQRRNLITHCNGIVSEQYLEACTAAGYPIDPSVTVGTRLNVDADYLRTSLDILYEVGIKLSHVLWRKASPGNIAISEELLTDELFSLLTREEWELAKRMGEFAINIPDQQKDLQKRISRINHAQALKWSGERVKANKILDAVDWSGSIRDLRLAVEVLRENYDGAAKLMREIGKRGELLLRSGYETWPVFREFRKTDQFRAAFKDVYGMDFTEKSEVSCRESAKKTSSEPVSTAAESIPRISGPEENLGEASMPPKQPAEDDAAELRDGNTPSTT